MELMLTFHPAKYSKRFCIVFFRGVKKYVLIFSAIGKILLFYFIIYSPRISCFKTCGYSINSRKMHPSIFYTHFGKDICCLYISFPNMRHRMNCPSNICARAMSTYRKFIKITMSKLSF